tara:strand:+ start:2017 stop:2796 length:780 start_codon:yes stop_codon:yes gene_type:complete
MKRIVLVTGGFDPLHSGHIAYLNAASKLGDELLVGVNSDDWLTRKKGRPFMPFEERVAIVQELKAVDGVFGFIDKDNTARMAIHYLLTNPNYRMPLGSKLIFANGGDRTAETTPEFNAYRSYPHIEFAYGVGGEDKKNSSSWILEEWKTPKTERPWGFYRLLDSGPGWAVKELTIEPGKSLSDQRHKHRSEHWHVVQGNVTIDTEWKERKSTITIGPKDSYDIDAMVWHRPHNNGTEPVKIIETWFGNILAESDIERRE